MASQGRATAEDGRRTGMSPRPRGRDNAKETLCRNVTIYGHCRWENKGCAFNHDPMKAHNTPESTKKRLNVDSPSFTPLSGSPNLSVNGLATKPPGLSPKIANAAPFKPKTFTAGSESMSFNKKQQYNPAAADWSLAPAAEMSEFIPEATSMAQNLGDPSAGMGQGMYDPYVTSTTPLGSAASGLHQTTLNPYANDQPTNGATSYFQNTAFAQPAQYHLYTSLGPHRENVPPQQRAARDFFISDQLREELQRKSAAQLQILPNSSLPPNIDFFHSLVPLDTTNQRNTTLFGFPSWIYKAVSGNDGKHYALRRVEGFRLNDDRAMLPIKTAWKRVINANIVTIIDAFTNRTFGDSALFLVTDYHPLSKTLAEAHLGASHHGGSRFAGRQHQNTVPVTEQSLWSYIFQISNALRAIHAAGLAARILDPSKILLTNKNRIRLNGCGVLDVVQWGPQAPNAVDLQREDFVLFGKLILQLGLSGSKGVHNVSQSLEQFGRSYSAGLKERVGWLLNFLNPQRQMEPIDSFIAGLAPQMMGAFDSAMHETDQLTSELGKELENGRLVRLMTKINFITERPDFSHDQSWSETGERYPIKLFRDWVFHQVDQHGNPRLDLAHVISCLNKLDAGSEERMTLISRDEQTCILVSYREMKRAIEGAYQDLAKASRRSGNM